jgi:HPt (histidine-containing phosphotransfer) domain-containing protein
MAPPTAAGDEGPQPQAGELDLGRLTDLQRVLGSGLPEIIAKLIAELEQAIGDVQSAVAADDLTSAAHAAHAARNSALMLDARPTLDALATVESGARAGKRAAVRAGTEDLEVAWPALRRRLEQAAATAG